MKKLILLILLFTLPVYAQQANQQLIAGQPIAVGLKQLYLFDYMTVTKYDVTSMSLQENFRVPKNHSGQELIVACDIVSYTYLFKYDFKGAGNVPANWAWGGTKFDNIEGKIVDLSGSFNRHRIELEIPWDRAYSPRMVNIARPTVRPLLAYELLNTSISLSNFDNNNKQTYGSESWSKSNLGIGFIADYPLPTIRFKGKAVWTFLNGSSGFYGEVKAASGVGGGMGLGLGYTYSTRLINFNGGDFRSITSGPFFEIVASF